MRVLWLANSPALGARLLQVPLTHETGWVAALEGVVKQHLELDLSIAFPWSVPATRRIRSDRHEYLAFPRFPRGGRLRRLLVDASCRLEPESEIDHLERVVELSRPDLIHVWGTEAHFGLVAERTDLPVLIGLQGLRVACTQAYLRGLSWLDLLRFGSLKHLLNGRSLLHRYHRYRRSAMRERRMLARARFVCGRTEWDRTVSAALAPEARYFHCDEVLRPPFYETRRAGRRTPGPLRLVSVLRGNAYKGFETVAGCAALLERLLPDGLEWTLIGIRPGQEVQRIVERKLGVSFSRLGLHPVGSQPAEEVARRLAESDLYVLPTWIDNSPNSLCEAMMVGLPVVTTHVGGIPSLIEHGEEGLLVPPGDEWSLAASILRLARDTELAQRLGAAARRRAAERHDPVTVARALGGIYSRILESAAA